MFSAEPFDNRKTDFCTTIMTDFAAQLGEVIATSSSTTDAAAAGAATDEDNNDDDDAGLGFDAAGGDDDDDGDGFGDEDGNTLTQTEQLQLCSILSIIPPASYLDSCLANKRAPPP